MKLRVEDLRIDIYRAPGQGAWSSQPERAVRITHTPTGISVEEHSDRSPHRNRVLAMKKLEELVEATDESVQARKVLDSLTELVPNPECDFGPAYEGASNRQKEAIQIMKRQVVELAELKAKFTKAMEALELADGIMSVSRGDAYERECTEKDYDKFNELWDDLSGAKEARERQYAQAEKERLEQIRLAEKKKADKKANEIACPQCKKICQGPQGLLEHSKVKHKVTLSVTTFKEILKQQRGGK